MFYWNFEGQGKEVGHCLDLSELTQNNLELRKAAWFNLNNNIESREKW